MRTIVKLLIALSVATNPIALLADGSQGTTAQIAPAALSHRHLGNPPSHKADSAGPVSAACPSPCCGHDMYKVQRNHHCSFHHHPAFVAADSTFYPVTAPHLVTLGLNARMSSHDFQPETPPPKYF